MTLRRAHGRGAGALVRAETMPADELPLGMQAPPQASAGGERRADSTFDGPRAVRSRGGGPRPPRSAGRPARPLAPAAGRGRDVIPQCYAAHFTAALPIGRSSGTLGERIPSHVLARGRVFRFHRWSGQCARPQLAHACWGLAFTGARAAIEPASSASRP